MLNSGDQCNARIEQAKPVMPLVSGSPAQVHDHPGSSILLPYHYFTMILIMKAADFIRALPSSLFWDVDTERLDAVKDAVFIIARVMDRGCRADVDLAWTYYGEERIRDGLLQAPFLEKRTLAYFSHYFGIPLSSFKACARRQSIGAWSM